MFLPRRKIVIFPVILLLFLISLIWRPHPIHAQTPTHAPVSYGVDDKGFFIKDKNTGALKMRFDFSTGYLNAPMRTSSAGSSGNLVPNNGFENGTDSSSSTTTQIAFQWEQSSGVTACTSCFYTRESSSFGGSSALSFYTNNSTAGSATASIASDTFEVQPGTVYTGLIDLKSNAALTNVKVQVAFYAGDAGTKTYSTGYNSAGTYGAVTDVYTSASFNTASWTTLPNSTGISITAPTGTPCATGTQACTLARIFIQHQGTTGNATAKLFADNVKFGTNLTQSNTSAINASYVSAGAFGSNTGGGTYSFPGNVGIGTTGPSVKLEVNENASSPVDLYVKTVDGQNATSYLWSGPDYWRMRHNGSNNLLDISYNGTQTAGLSINTSGNVGIGTTAPGSILHIAKTGTATTIGAKDARILLQNDTGTVGAGGEIVFTYSADTNTERYAAIGTYATANDGTGGAGNLYFATKQVPADTALTERLTILNTGNVGIGTTGPQRSLHVLSGSSAVPSARFERTGINYGEVYFDANSPGSGMNLLLGGTGWIRGQSDGGVSLGTYANSQTAGPANGLIVSGNVGIGTTGPGAKLTVAGSGGIGQSVNLDNREIKIRGDGDAHYSLFANRVAGTLTIEDTSANSAMGTAGTVMMAFQKTSGNVGIGTTGPVAKLDVNGTLYVESAGYHGIGVAPDANMALRIGGTFTGSSYTTGINVGQTLNGLANQNVIGMNLGSTLVEAGSGTHNLLAQLSVGAPAITAGVASVTEAATLYISDAPSAVGATNLALHVAGGTSSFAGNVGIGTTAPAYQLQLSTDSAAKPTTNTWTIASDARIKNVAGNFSKGLNEILQVNPIIYTYKENNALGIVDPGEHIGIIAQEVQKVFPEAVSIDPNGYLHFNSDALSWASINAIKEQQAQITKLQQEIEALKAKIQGMQ